MENLEHGSKNKNIEFMQNCQYSDLITARTEIYSYVVVKAAFLKYALRKGIVENSLFYFKCHLNYFI